MNVLILAGGSGTRFWPASRRDRPKQFLGLGGERSLLQQTWERVRPLCAEDGVWVCTTERLHEEVVRQLPEVPPEQVLAEPTGRNTAPAIGWSLMSMPETARRRAVAVLPSDHWVADEKAFRATLERAVAALEKEDRVLTLGVRPRWAETGYGYLELAEPPREDRPVPVARFTEKPDPATAEAFVAGGRHLWNAGIFVFRPETLLHHLRRHCPELARGLEALSGAPDEEAHRALYAALPSVSIDTGVMEKLHDIGTLPLDCGWSDLGSWDALAELLEADSEGNRTRGDVLTVDARGNLVVAERGTVALLDVEDLIVVNTGDAVLVLPRGRAQEVRRIVDALRAAGRDELL